MTDYTASPYYPTAVAAAQRYGVPTDLFVKQIGQESSFNPWAVNGRATGISQFMPGTAADFNLNPYDPDASLYAAAQYDRQLYDRLGSWEAALRAYGTTAGGAGADVNELAKSYDNPSWLSSFFRGTANLIGDATRGAEKVTNAVTAPVKSAGAAIAFISDLPRVATTLIGIVLLIAGIFALTRGPAVNIVTEAVKEAATS